MSIIEGPDAGPPKLEAQVEPNLSFFRFPENPNSLNMSYKRIQLFESPRGRPIRCCGRKKGIAGGPLASGIRITSRREASTGEKVE